MMPSLGGNVPSGDPKGSQPRRYWISLIAMASIAIAATIWSLVILSEPRWGDLAFIVFTMFWLPGYLVLGAIFGVFAKSVRAGIFQGLGVGVLSWIALLGLFLVVDRLLPWPPALGG